VSRTVGRLQTGIIEELENLKRCPNCHEIIGSQIETCPFCNQAVGNHSQDARVAQAPPFPDPLTTVLRQGETVLWTGTPSPGIRFHIQGIFSLVFYAVIAIIAFIFRTTSDAVSCFAAWAVLLLLFYTGYLLLVDPIRRQKTSYEVTNQRIIIKSSFISQSVRPVELYSVKNLSRKIHKDGTGTIFFDKVSFLKGSSFPPYQLAPVFEFVCEPNKVYNIIEKARAVSKQPA
jgi:hypothetical protein